MRTGYYKALEDAEANGGHLSSSTGVNSESEEWRVIWSAKIQPKIKTFMWRLLSSLSQWAIYFFVEEKLCRGTIATVVCDSRGIMVAGSAKSVFMKLLTLLTAWEYGRSSLKVIVRRQWTFDNKGTSWLVEAIRGKYLDLERNLWKLDFFWASRNCNRVANLVPKLSLLWV